MPTPPADLATETRTAVCSRCKGQGEVCVGETSGTFDMAQACWYPDEVVYPCDRCKGRGEVKETFCLVCTELTDSCSCTDEQIERYLLTTYLGAA